MRIPISYVDGARFRRSLLAAADWVAAGRDIPEFAAALRAELVDRYRPRQRLVSPVTPVIAAHAGIGAWGAFYQIEDGTSA